MSLFILSCFLWTFICICHLNFNLWSRLLLFTFLFVFALDFIGWLWFVKVKLWLGFNVTFECFHIAIILLKGWCYFAFHLFLHSAVHYVFICDKDQYNNDQNNSQNYKPFTWMKLTIKNFTALIWSYMFHFADGHFYLNWIKFWELLFIHQQNWILSHFLSDIILALFLQPQIVINLLSWSHKRLVHLSLNIIVINFSQHHWISRANRQLALIHKYVTFCVT